MKMAYADPPYLGCGKLYKEHPDWAACDTIEFHAEIIRRLEIEYPDGWALSCTSGNLFDLLPLFDKAKRPRIGSWQKPFAIFKPNVNPAYTWEPVIFWGGRKGDRTRKTVKDHLACNITLKKGLTGAKPVRFCEWVLDLLGYQEGDTLDDLFPGTGIMGRVANLSEPSLNAPHHPQYESIFSQASNHPNGPSEPLQSNDHDPESTCESQTHV